MNLLYPFLIAAGFLTLISARAEVSVYFIAPSAQTEPMTDEALDGIFETRLDTALFTPLLQGAIANGAGPNLGVSTRIGRVFVNPESGELAVVGIDSGVRFIPIVEQVVEVPGCNENGQTFITTVIRPANWRHEKEADRSVRVWKMAPGHGLPVLAYTSPFPEIDFGAISAISNLLAYPGPHTAAGVDPDWVHDPAQIIRGGTYHFQSSRVLVPIHEKILSFAENQAGINVKPDFGAFDDFSPRTVRQATGVVANPLTGEVYFQTAENRLEFYIRSFEERIFHPDCGNGVIINPTVFRLRERQRTTVIARMAADGRNPTLFEIPPGSEGPGVEVANFRHTGIDPYAGWFFASDAENGRILKKALNRVDSSYLATLDLTKTGRSEFDFTALPGSFPDVLRLHAEPVSRRLYWLAGDTMLRSMKYDGTDVTHHLQLPAGTKDFAIFNSAGKPATPDARLVNFRLTSSLPFGSSTSNQSTLSADGRIIGGNSGSGDETAADPSTGRNQATLQAFGGEPFGLGFPKKGASDASTYTSAVRALSADGRVALLDSFVAGAGSAFALWDAASGHRTAEDSLSQFPGDARALSGDGSVVVGGNANLPVLWTAPGGTMSLPTPVNRTASGVATAISADALVIAGEATGAGGTEAFRWSAAGGVVSLGDLPGGKFFSTSQAISRDGKVVVGESYYNEKGTGFLGMTLRDESQPFYHSDATGMVAMGILDERIEEENTGSALGISDGGVVIGRSNGKAFIWHPVTGIVDLQHFVESTYGIDLGGANLISANAISADGKVIVGTARDASFDTHGFVLTLPNFPADRLLSLRQLSLEVDSDGDGMPDLAEAMFGSDPFKADAPRQATLDLQHGNRRVSFIKPAVATGGQVLYQIEASEDLAAWSAVGLTISTDNNQLVEVEDSLISSPRFYRVKAQLAAAE